MSDQIKLTLETPAPSLTLDPFAEQAEEKKEEKPADPAVLDESVLSPEERQMVSSFAEQVNFIMASGAIGFTLSRLYDEGDEKSGLLNENRDFKISREGIAKIRAINKRKAFSEQ